MINFKKVNAATIADYFNLSLNGKDVTIDGPCSINNLVDGKLIFLKYGEQSTIDLLNKYENILVLCTLEISEKLTCPNIVCNNPRLIFLRTVKKFFLNSTVATIHQTAEISTNAVIGKNASIGAFTKIDCGVVIGENSTIGNNVTITGNVTIGDNCYIKSGAVIGEPGFGFEPNEQGVPEHFPQIGSIVIGNDVFIGANSTVEMAALDETYISNGVKIDDLVQVGHNTFIGENTMIMSGAVLCGGVKTGKSCWIAPNSSVRQKLTIGDNVTVGLGAVVVNNISDNAVFAGNPAKQLHK